MEAFFARLLHAAARSLSTQNTIILALQHDFFYVGGRAMPPRLCSRSSSAAAAAHFQSLSHGHALQPQACASGGRVPRRAVAAAASSLPADAAEHYSVLFTLTKCSRILVRFQPAMRGPGRREPLLLAAAATAAAAAAHERRAPARTHAQDHLQRAPRISLLCWRDDMTNGSQCSCGSSGC